MPSCGSPRGCRAAAQGRWRWRWQPPGHLGPLVLRPAGAEDLQRAVPVQPQRSGGEPRFSASCP
eukprot:7971776-Alexandrium_andersonii.AAC.1